MARKKSPKERAAEAFALYEQALVLGAEVLREVCPIQSRHDDEQSIANQMYRGHDGFRRLKILTEKEQPS